MKNLFTYRLLMLLAALPLFFSCTSHKQYLFSPTAGAYHGAYHNTKKQVTPAATEAALADAATAQAPADLTPQKEAPAAAVAPAAELTTVASRVQAAQLQKAAATSSATAKADGKKLNFAEKVMLKKIMKKAGKQQQVNNASPLEMASSMALDRNLKLALIFLIASLIGYIFFWLIGTILLIIALVFFILWVSEL